MLYDFANPINYDHPLNRNRVAWYLMLPNSPRFVAGATNVTDRPYPDLFENNNGLIKNGSTGEPGWETPEGFPVLQWDLGSSIDGYVELGAAAAFDLTDNFTLTATIKVGTTTPSGGLAGIITKYLTPASSGYYLRQNDQKLEFGGSSQIATGNFLTTTDTYRVVCTSVSGTGTIYVNGVAVVSGAVAFSSTADAVRIGTDYNGRYFQGQISDVSICSRPWSAEEVMQDYLLQQRGYRGEFSPLRFIKLPYRFAEPDVVVVSFTTTVGASPTLLFATPGNFTTTIEATASATGLGPLEPETTAEFLTNVGYRTPFQAGEPTLVNLVTYVMADQTIQVGAPASFTTEVRASQTIRTIPNGDRRILSQGRYRR